MKHFFDNRNWMVGMVAIVAAFTGGIAGANEEFVWEEKFDIYDVGAITEQSKRWYLDQGEEDERENYRVASGADGGMVLEVHQNTPRTRLGLRFRPLEAYDNESNRVVINFYGSDDISSPLLVSYYADNGTTLVATLQFNPGGEVVLYHEKGLRSREVLPILWMPGEWNQVFIEVYPEAGKTRIGLEVEGGTEQNVYTKELVRNNPGGTLPWWALHFSQTSVSATPWLIRSVTLENASLEDK